ncbi:MAG: protein kinase [Myxococcota bacterium]|nr:protein kinase [Myxococcota bacterium]
MSEASSWVGEELGGHRLLKLLGVGPHGASYLARPLRGPRLQLVLKQIHPERLRHESFVMWWQGALESAALLRAPTIRALHLVALSEPTPYLLSDYISGMTLAQRLEKGPLRPSEAIAFLEGALQALYFAHEQGQLHGNLKASNLILDPERRCWLSDFGSPWAAWPQQARPLIEASAFGPIAPELFAGGQTSPSVDLYALGVLIWFALSGYPQPSPGQQIPQPLPLSAVGDFPLPLSGFIDRLISSDPRSRFEDTSTALTLLREIRAGRGDALLGKTLPAPYQPPAEYYTYADDRPHSDEELDHSNEELDDELETRLLSRPAREESVAPAPANPLPAPSMLLPKPKGRRQRPSASHQPLPTYSEFLQGAGEDSWLDELVATPPEDTDNLRALERRERTPSGPIVVFGIALLIALIMLILHLMQT